MMLHLHIGTEKTGSSFLQTLSVLGRQALLADGVFFPKGMLRHESRMATGLVSAGNGYPISRALSGDCWEQIDSLLKEAAREAKAKNSSSVLYSSELLLTPLCRPAALQRFHDSACKAGFSSLRLLVILRDPAAQVLSLYKHRARGGTAGMIEHWVRTGYDLPQNLAALRRAVPETGVTLTARKYGRGDGVLARIFFTDWLGVAPPQVRVPACVNPSLSLSELALLRLLADRRPDVVGPLYDHLLRLDPAEKLQGAALEAHAAAVAAAAAAAHRAEWEAWNALLPEGEALAVPEAPDAIPPAPREMGFSEAQMAELARFLATSATARFVMGRLWTNRLRPVLGRAKRTVLGSALR